MLTKLVGAAILATLTILSHAQKVSQVRYEMPLHSGQTMPHRTVSLQENGLLVYGTVIADGQNAIEVVRLDTAFQEVWKGFIKIERGMTLVNSKFVGERIYMLLKDRFNPQAEFQVLTIHIEKGNYGIENVQTMIPFLPTHFDITDQAVLIGGHFNYRPLVLYYSFVTKQSKILPGFFNEPGDLDQLRTDSTGNIDIVVSGKSMTRKRSLWIRNYDPKGDLIKTIVLQPEEDKNLIYGRSVGTTDGNQVVCGVYGRYTEYSRGIFIASIDPYGEYKINYYSFADLERFFNYMKAKRERRVKDRLERRKVKGKKIRLNYRIMVTDLMPYGDQFIMMGEAFYPHYSYPTSARAVGGWYMPSRYLSPTRGDLVFDGYQYTHAVVVGFDRNGALKWDNSFEINDVRTFQLEQFVKILPEKDKISLLYLYDNTIRSKIIRGAEVVEGKSYDPLAMSFTDDVVKERDTQQTKLEYWYGDVFYATGIQQIRNLRDAGVNLSRRVFFINKIDYK